MARGAYPGLEGSPYAGRGPAAKDSPFTHACEPFDHKVE